MDNMEDNMDDMDNLFIGLIIYGYNMYIDLYDYNMCFFASCNIPI